MFFGLIKSRNTCINRVSGGSERTISVNVATRGYRGIKLALVIGRLRQRYVLGEEKGGRQ